MDFTPSKYQQAIFDYIANGQGHLVVEAAAGSGKTSTLVKGLYFIPKDKNILFVAFNKDVVKELEKRTKKFSNVKVRTLHSLGFLMLRRSTSEALKLEVYKYSAHVRNNYERYTSINPYKLKKGGWKKYFDNVNKYVDFARYYLCESEGDLDFIEDRYGIETIADEKRVAMQALEWGKVNLDKIDYTDMVWLPNALGLSPSGLQYDYVMVDECQDMNKAERMMILKCFKEGTRMVAVGDTNQMLYSFAGGDPESFNALKSIPNTKCLPLSISYRCAKNVVNFAKRLVPSIEYNEASGREGEILTDVPLTAVKDGDMILCRNNAPLVQIYNEFLKQGKKAYIRGKDIGKNLIALVENTKKSNLNTNCLKDGVFARLYYDLFMTRNSVMEKSEVNKAIAMGSQQVQSKLDMIQALEILSEDISTADELISKLGKIFSQEEESDGISLSTIHKAKGLEAENVYIACKSLMPSKSAEKDWEKKQEYNLMYVAYTRAKNTLGFIDEKDFEKFNASNENNQQKLKAIEAIVGHTLGKTTEIAVTADNAKAIIEQAKKITATEVDTTPTVELSSIGNKSVTSFADLLKNKRQKTRQKWAR